MFVWGQSPCENLWDHFGKREKLDLRSTKGIHRHLNYFLGWSLVNSIPLQESAPCCFSKRLYLKYQPTHTLCLQTNYKYLCSRHTAVETVKKLWIDLNQKISIHFGSKKLKRYIKYYCYFLHFNSKKFRALNGTI